MVTIYQFKNVNFFSKSIVSICVVTFLASLSVTLASNYTQTKISISLCLPFSDPTGYVMIIKIVTWFVVLSQMSSSVVIVVLHILLVIELKKNQTKINSSKVHGVSNTLLIIQLVTITASNILCWIPANSIFVSAMFLPTYPTDLIIWTTVIGLPLNSVINPSVFITTSIRIYLSTRIRDCDDTFHGLPKNSPTSLAFTSVVLSTSP